MNISNFDRSVRYVPPCVIVLLLDVSAALSDTSAVISNVSSAAVSRTPADSAPDTFSSVANKSFPAVSDTSAAVTDSSVVVPDASPVSAVSGSVFEVVVPGSSVCLSCDTPEIYTLSQNCNIT